MTRAEAVIVLKTEPANGLLAAFLSGRSDSTRRAYSQDLDDFRRFLAVDIVSEAARLLLSRGHGEANALALAWRANLQERRLQAATINRRLAALRSLVQLARTLGIVPWTLEVRNVRSESYRDTRGPSRRGVRLLLDEVERRGDRKALRDRAALRLLMTWASAEVKSSASTWMTWTWMRAWSLFRARVVLRRIN